MSEEKTYLTPEGKADLERELADLVNVRRPQLAIRLKEAVAMGDLKENADYHDTKEQMGLMDGRIHRLQSILRAAEVIDNDGSTDEVGIGSTVTIREVGSDSDETYTIVGPAEANPREGKISQKSPIGAALLGKKKGRKVKVETPEGIITFEIRKIK
ncbi:MAG: transcription elongation factor GreA [Anaerolineae bacterium]|nr:transcription elongation factor GreA [Anaerolineae bacterium]